MAALRELTAHLTGLVQDTESVLEGDFKTVLIRHLLRPTRGAAGPKVVLGRSTAHSSVPASSPAACCCTAWAAADEGSRGDLNGALGSWLQPGPALAITGIGCLWE